MTFHEIVLRARHLLAEPDEGFLTNEEFMDWANDCSVDLAMRLPPITLHDLEATSDWDITTATMTITLPTNVLKPIQFRIVDTRNAEIMFPDDYEYITNTLIGMEISSFYYGKRWGNNISFSSLPVNKVLRLYYIKRPAIIVSDRDIPEFPVEVQIHLFPQYLAMEASTKLKDTANANHFKIEYEMRLQEMVKKYKGKRAQQVNMSQIGENWE